MASKRDPKLPTEPVSLHARSPRGKRAVQLFELPVGRERLIVLSFDAPSPPATELTAAERAVAVLAVEGLSTRAIAARRGSSTRTVSNQLASVYEKLDVRSRVELAAKLTKASP